jgi:hypothetical protein
MPSERFFSCSAVKRWLVERSRVRAASELPVSSAQWGQQPAVFLRAGRLARGDAGRLAAQVVERLHRRGVEPAVGHHALQRHLRVLERVGERLVAQHRAGVAVLIAELVVGPSHAASSRVCSLRAFS